MADDNLGTRLRKAFDNEDRVAFEEIATTLERSSSLMVLPQDWKSNVGVTNSRYPEGLKGDEQIQVLFRSMSSMKGIPRNFSWAHNGRRDDIIAYMVIEW